MASNSVIPAAPHAHSELLRRLSGGSAPYRDPLGAVNWAELGPHGFWLPEPALSLYGLPEYGALAPATRQRLSHYEFANVLHCGLWLEGVLLQRLARRLHPGLPRAEHEYVLHELREEAGHSLMFLRAIEAGGLALPEQCWHAPRLARALARLAPAEGALFWLAMLIGEDVPDRFNRYLCARAHEVNPAIRQICTLHASDEARHIALARRRLEAALAPAGAARRELLSAAARLVLRQLVRAFYFPPARFYELAGLAPGTRWRRLALANGARLRFVEQCLAPTLDMLGSCGLKVTL
ncbi:MAG TPA: diiron oxygenase [Burkholderiales bacterium]|nr:diiron oxygenase [Burkholderiales bacterium]